MAVLFAFLLFLSATLLFLVQPLAGKTLLPLVGGTPAAWNTCLVFFQLLLLLGYLYADRLGRRPPIWQWIAHTAVSLAGLAAAYFLRPDPAWIPTESEYPVFGLLAYLGALIGLPFFVLSATAPLMQKWFGLCQARDPYFLYAASNAGSFCGLLAYPLLVEPILTLNLQREIWNQVLGAVLLGVICAGLGMVLAVRGKVADEIRTPTAPLPWRRQLKWVILAAIPSSLLLGCTTHLTTDLAPIPLLWVIPLGLYLASFVFVFARWKKSDRIVVPRVTAMLMVFLSVVLLSRGTEPLWLVGGVHLFAFLAIALLCHGELAHDRPPTAHLTRFYLMMSLGGVLGGTFNALLAPLLFARLGLVEYPLLLVVAACVRPKPLGGLERLQLNRRDGGLLVAFTALALLLFLYVPRTTLNPELPEAMAPRIQQTALVFGIPGIALFALAARPARFALGLAIFLTIGQFEPGPYGIAVQTTRNFFGTLRVVRSPDGRLIRLVHGTTLHGQQWLDREGRPEPLMYYQEKSPIGNLLTKLPPERRQRVGAVGLGCGALAAYAQPGEDWTFFEIDPAVARIAQDSRYFTFLSTCRGTWRIELGDARKKLESFPDRSFDLLVLDAFNSDSIPVHLLTREAFALYLRKLAPGGMLAFHLSNRYLDLPPLVASQILDLQPSWLVRENRDLNGNDETGRFPSIWVMAGATELKAPSGMPLLPYWTPLPPRRSPIWTDQFSNLLSVWKRDEE